MAVMDYSTIGMISEEIKPILTSTVVVAQLLYGLEQALLERNLWQSLNEQ